MAVPPIQSVGLVSQGALAAVSTVTGQSAKFASLLRNKLGAVAGAASSSRPLDANRLRASVNADLKQIQSRLVGLAAQQGVNLTGGVTLQVDSNGVAHVAGSSDNRSALEALVASDPELEKLLASASKKSGLLNAMGALPSSANAGGVSGALATPAASSGPPGSSGTFTLFVSPQQTSVSFQPAVV